MTNETIAAPEQTSKHADGESELNAGLGAMASHGNGAGGEGTTTVGARGVEYKKTPLDLSIENSRIAWGRS